MHARISIALFAVAAFFGSASWAQSYPSKPVRIVVPFSAGGGTDIFARLIGRKLQDNLGQPFVIDNRAGGSGIIGLGIVARASPDGYTLLMGTNGTQASNPAVYSNLPYDTLKDFASISLIADSPFILLVSPSLPVASVKDLIEYAKARPGQLSYGSSGVGQSSHLGFELFNRLTGIKAIHVPFKGLPPATAETMAGNLTMTWDTITASAPHIRAKKLRALGIGSAQRSPLLLEVPTISESGIPGFQLSSWYAMLAPAGTPPEIVRLLQREIVKVLEDPEVRERFAALGAEVIGSTPEQLTATIKRDLAVWQKIAREANVKLE